MEIGFTGTRKGMTGAQENRLAEMLLTFVNVTGFRHGVCVGADANAVRIVIGLNLYSSVVAYPSNIPSMTDIDALDASDVVHDPEPPLQRNKSIVNASNVLIATPGTMEEELRSGTWATVRYARKLGTPVRIIWPNGTLTFK